MNRTTLLALIVGGIVAGWVITPVIAAKDKGKGKGAGGGSAPVLTQAETDGLQFMHEEEKLARDVYLAMGVLYDQRVFVNIPRSEQRHMEAIQGLCGKYGIGFNVKEPGKFHDPELQKLYDRLVERGTVSRQDAFLVGALIEEIDIQDLRDRIKRTQHNDIKAVYENLERGSMRHLNAFVFNFENRTGKTYVAQKMPQSEVDKTLNR